MAELAAMVGDRKTDLKTNVKNTFLEVFDDSVRRAPGRGRAHSDTTFYQGPGAGPGSAAGTPAKHPLPSPQKLPAYSPHKLPMFSPQRKCSGTPQQRLPAWPETPLLEAAFEHQGLIKNQLLEDAQWMLPASIGDDGMNYEWMMMPCGPYPDFDFSAMPDMAIWGMGDGHFPSVPSSASTASGEEASADSSADSKDGEAKAAGGATSMFEVTDWRTTVMLRGLPTDLTRDVLAQMLNEQGFVGFYDLVYLPVDFSTGIGLGYAFVNCTLPSLVPPIWTAFDGRKEWPIESDKVCSASWSDPHQGLAAHIERYQNSPVMHPDVPEGWKPALYVHGMHVAFPPPSKRIKAPKVRSKKGSDEKARD